MNVRSKSENIPHVNWGQVIKVSQKQLYLFIYMYKASNWKIDGPFSKSERMKGLSGTCIAKVPHLHQPGCR